MIQIQRIYDAPPAGKNRYLVDRLWPRGIKKDSVEMEAWLKDAAPSNDLRKWYAHDPARWDEFRARYRQELDANPSAWQPLLDGARRGPLVLLYSSKERELNNAAALKEYLEAWLGS